MSRNTTFIAVDLHHLTPCRPPGAPTTSLTPGDAVVAGQGGAGYLPGAGGGVSRLIAADRTVARADTVPAADTYALSAVAGLVLNGGRRQRAGAKPVFTAISGGLCALDHATGQSSIALYLDLDLEPLVAGFESALLLDAGHVARDRAAVGQGLCQIESNAHQQR